MHAHHEHVVLALRAIREDALHGCLDGRIGDVDHHGVEPHLSFDEVPPEGSEAVLEPIKLSQVDDHFWFGH